MNWVKWREKLNRAAPTCQQWESTKSVEAMATQFGVFCHLSGSVLDVGCGSKRAPYLVAVEESVRLDPIPFGGVMVCGVGEYLPFRSSSFNHAVAATVLDHCVSPHKVVKEMTRVAESVHVWVNVWHQDGTIGQSQPKPSRNMIRTGIHLVRTRGFSMILQRLAARSFLLARHFVGLIPHKLSTRSDPYHLHHFREKDIARILDAAQLSITSQVVMRDGSIGVTARRTVFIKNNS